MEKVKFIAEISSNHNKDLVRTKELIHASAEAGCYGVKFQLFKIDELFSKEILLKSKKHRDRKYWELEETLIPEIADYCSKLKIEFGCSPFYLGAIDVLDDYVDFFKIASYEILWKELFEHCGNTGKPVSFSTGMANDIEVANALNLLKKTNTNDITIYQCNSAYPTPIDDANISRINVIKKIANKIQFSKQTNISFGYSDHTVSSAVIYRVVHRYNVSFVEFHIDLDGKGEEFSAGHCWLPNQIKSVIKNVNQGFLADGSGDFKPSVSELPDRDWRADPSDGLRPIKKIRKSFNG
jgi:sialic acid synthase SpsE